MNTSPKKLILPLLVLAPSKPESKPESKLQPKPQQTQLSVPLLPVKKPARGRYTIER